MKQMKHKTQKFALNMLICICAYLIAIEKDKLLSVNQISFKVNWVNTQAFLINLGLAFSMGYHLF